MFKEVPAPSRPAVPTSLICLAAAICAQRAVLSGSLAGPRACGLGSAILAAVFTAWLVCRRTGRAALCGALSAIAVSMLAFTVGSLTAWAVAAQMDSAQREIASCPVSTLDITLTSDMSKGTSLWRGRASVSAEGCALGDVWLQADRELPRGASVSCVGRFSANGDDEWGISSRMQGICGTVRAVRVKSVSQAEGPMGLVLSIRREVLGRILGTSPDQGTGSLYGSSSANENAWLGEGGGAAGRAILAGIVCGYTPAFKQEGLSDLFSACGISHMAAVSGSHLAVVTSIAGLLLERSRLPRWGKGASLFVFSGLFVCFCGFPASAVRSWVMSSIAFAAPLVGRRGHTLSSVSVAGLLMSLVNPTLSGQLGFLLSVSCVCGIALLGGYAKHVLLVLAGAGTRRRPPRLPEKIRVAWSKARTSCVETLAVTFVCQLASIPLTLPAYGVVSLIAPVTNLFIAPFFAPYLTLGLFVVLTQPLHQLQSLLLVASDAIGRACIGLLGILAKAPFACVALEVGETQALAVSLVFVAALLVAWPKVTRARILGVLGSLAVAVAIWEARWRYFAPARICVMDVGQADSILITDGAASILVDAGVDDAVRSALSRNHVRHLDAVVLTHLDEDHVGGLDDLAGTVQVDRVLVAKGVAGAMGAELLQTVRDLTGSGPGEITYGDVIRCGGFGARMVWPVEEVNGDENADSVELSVDFDRDGVSLTALLTGDGEQGQTGAVVASGDVGDVDLLKVGHHGSAASINADLARTLNAEVAVASAGEGNRYGHPRKECVEALESAGSEFLCTKDVGDVTVYPGAYGPSVACGRSIGQVGMGQGV